MNPILTPKKVMEAMEVNRTTACKRMREVPSHWIVHVNRVSGGQKKSVQEPRVFAKAFEEFFSQDAIRRNAIVNRGKGGKPIPIGATAGGVNLPERETTGGLSMVEFDRQRRQKENGTKRRESQ